MSKNLVIVESPAKAKTIEKYLGKDFHVLSSVGHIRKDTKVDIKNDFAVTYEIDPGHTKVVNELKKAVKSADTVWLATDEDREGESISWHLLEVLKLPESTHRITFHEITKPALEEAIKHPRTVDMAMVSSQQARQTLDMLVGPFRRRPSQSPRRRLRRSRPEPRTPSHRRKRTRNRKH